MTCPSTSAFSLAKIAAGLPARARSAWASIFARIASAERRRRDRQLAVVRLLGKPREPVEELRQVLAELRVGGEEAEVGVEARGPLVVVAGPEVHVAAQPLALAPHHQRRLGVRLQLGVAEEDVRAGPLERARPGDVVLLVEAGLDLDRDGDLLVVLRRADERAHHLGVGAGAVERHLDRQHVGVVGRLAQEREHRPERVVRVVQQDDRPCG